MNGKKWEFVLLLKNPQPYLPGKAAKETRREIEKWFINTETYLLEMKKSIDTAAKRK